MILNQPARSLFSLQKWSLAIAAIMTLSFFLNNCTPPSVNPAAATPKSPEDSLYTLAISLHDEAMPKIGKLKAFRLAADREADSLTGKAADSHRERIQELRRLSLQLKSAEAGMFSWMEQFNPDYSNPEQQERIRYFAAQHASAIKMRNDIFSALDSASLLLGH